MSRREFRRGGSRAGRGDSLSLQRLRLRRWEPNRSYHEKPLAVFPPPWSVEELNACFLECLILHHLSMEAPLIANIVMQISRGFLTERRFPPLVR